MTLGRSEAYKRKDKEKETTAGNRISKMNEGSDKTISIVIVLQRKEIA